MEEAQAKQEAHESKRKADALQAELALAKQRGQLHQNASQFCESLVQAGHIKLNEEGSYVVVSQEEQDGFREIMPSENSA